MGILQIGSPIMEHKDLYLRTESRELTREEVLNENFLMIVRYMFESLYEHPTGVGLAAPQIGLMIRLVVIDIKRNGREPLVLINPTYESISEEMAESAEGCLSFSGLQGTVLRHKKIRVCAKDAKFNDIEFETDTFLSFVCQHEIDHLNGVVYIDKSSDLRCPKAYNEILAEKSMDVLRLL